MRAVAQRFGRTPPPVIGGEATHDGGVADVFVTFTPVKVPERAGTTIGMLGSTGAVPAGVIVAEAMAHPLV